MKNALWEIQKRKRDFFPWYQGVSQQKMPTTVIIADISHMFVMSEFSSISHKFHNELTLKVV